VPGDNNDLNDLIDACGAAKGDPTAVIRFGQPLGPENAGQDIQVQTQSRRS
jgi:uncharacterized protein YukJ